MASFSMALKRRCCFTSETDDGPGQEDGIPSCSSNGTDEKKPKGLGLFPFASKKHKGSFFEHPFAPENGAGKGEGDVNGDIGGGEAAPRNGGETKMRRFSLLAHSKVNGRFPVELFRSIRTGLRLAIVQVPGPIVNGYFTLATEAHDDDGLPHTLEHLIFLGSECYPFKGTLDMLANRCLSSGTNAWTDTDHTAYTMTTAGSEGFLRLLPIYLDHILFPELSQSGFLTEVHHINGEGEDAGVVYAEMQGVENQGGTLSRRAVLKALYPGKCGYKSETGGAMKNLRDSTTLEKVVNYHRQFYRPENLLLIITGQIDAEMVFKYMEKFELKIEEHKDVQHRWREDFRRPWFTTPVPDFTASVESDVLFPSNEEDNGIVVVGFRGPSAVNDHYRLVAIDILLDYLTDTALSPLEKRFVNCEVPLASGISYSVIENSSSAILFKFSDVPVVSLKNILPALLEVFANISSPSWEYDSDRMATLIHKEKCNVLTRIETDPHDSTAENLIGHFLYGEVESMEERLDLPGIFSCLENEPHSFWKELFKSFFGPDQPHACVRACPSVSRKEEIRKEEEARVQERKSTFKKKCLKLKEEELEKAVDSNEAPVPDAILSTLPIASADGVNFHEITVFASWEDASFSPENFSFRDFPAKVPFHLCDADTNFVHLTVVIDVSQLPEPLRPLLCLYLNVLHESPILRSDGTGLTYGEVVQGLERDTLSVGAALGIGGAGRFNTGKFSSFATIDVKVELQKYVSGILWLTDLLFWTDMSSERLLVEANRIVNSVSAKRKSGSIMARCLHASIRYPVESYINEFAPVRQQEYVLSSVLSVLSDGKEDGEKEHLFERLKSIKEFLITPGRQQIHMATNLTRLREAVQLQDLDFSSPWRQIFFPTFRKTSGVESMTGTSSKLESIWDWSFLKAEPDRSRVLTLGSVDSSFLVLSCPVAVRSYQHPDLAALFVAIQYLCQSEGPLWREVRGKGLAYNCQISLKPEEGLIYLFLEKCTHLAKAFAASKKAVLSILPGKCLKKKWNKEALESARSSLIFEIIQEKENVSDVIGHAFLSVFQGIPSDFDRGFIQRVWTVPEKEIISVASRYLSKLFLPEASRIGIVCPLSKVSEIRDGFKDFDVKVYSRIEESPLQRNPGVVLPEVESDKKSSSDSESE